MTSKEKSEWLEVLQEILRHYGIFHSKHNGFHKWSRNVDYHGSKGYITSKSKDVIIAWADGFLEGNGDIR